MRDDVAVDHAETALSIGNVLAAGAADLPAHVPIDRAPHQRHFTHIVHAGADQKLRARSLSGFEKTGNLLGQMLAIGIENDHPDRSSFEPVTEAALDRFALPAVLFVNNNIAASL